MLILLSGPDTFRSRQYLKKMLAKFKADRDPEGLNAAILDCEKTEGPAILEQIFSAPFLADKKLIVLENFLTAAQKQDTQEEMLARAKNKTLPESSNLIFWEAEAKPKTKAGKELWEILSKEKFSQTFEPLAGAKLSAWANQEIKSRGGKINPAALNYLINNAGGDMWRLNSLIDQLVNYAQEKEIVAADVQLFLEEKTDDNIFNLVDAIVARQTKQVYQMIREQYRKGEDAFYILAMLARQFRILLQLRDIFDREDNPKSDDLAKRLGLHPFVVKKSLPMVKRYTMRELKNIYGQLLELDAKIKTGQGGPEFLLDLFVGKLSIS